MKSYSVINKIGFFFLIFVIVSAMAISSMFGLTAQAEAGDAKTAYEQTSVTYDLEQMGFNLEEYPKDAEGDVALFAFMEYGFNELVNETDDYGLYFYVYNPQELQFDFESNKNMAQFGVAYDENGACTDYDKYQLELVNLAENGRYLKLKVFDELSFDLHRIVKSAERRYDISSIELIKKGELNAEEHTVATTFYYTGYAKGFAEDVEAESSLQCRTVELETIELEVKHTTYKVCNTDNVSGQELASVYFNVPDKYFDDYGNLQQIKAEWLYSITDYIYLTNMKDLYDKFITVLGQEVIFNESLGYGIIGDIYYQDWGGANYYDAYNYDTNNILINIKSRIKSINWLLYDSTESISSIQASSEELLKFYKDHQDLDLFSHVDSSKTITTIDAGDTYDLKGLDSNHSGWEWLWEFLGFTETVAQVNPIHIVTDADSNLSDEDFASQLKVGIKDVSNIKSMHSKTGSKTVLFRFAINDFITDECNVEILPSYDAPEDERGAEYGVIRSKLPLYQDFDIIQLGFQKNGQITIIPAVSDPISIIGSVEPPLDNNDKDWSGDALIDSILPDDVDDTLKQIMEIIAKIVGGIIIAFLAFVIIKMIIALKPKIFKVKYKESKPKAKSKNVKKNKGVKPPKI